MFGVGIVLGGVAVAVVQQSTGPGALTRARYPVEARIDVGSLAQADTGSALVTVARQVLTGVSVGETPLASEPGWPVYVCAHRPPASPACGRGEGDGLQASLQIAAEAARGHIDSTWSGRVTVDVEVLSEEVRFDALGHRKRDPGLWGYRMGEAFVVPADVLAADVYGGDEESKSFRPAVLASVLRERFGVDVGARAAMYRFRTVAWAEPAAGAPVALRTYRLHGYEAPATDPDALLEAAVWAADHLASTIEPNGRIRYLFDVSEGKEMRGYNLLRHGGSTYALLQAYQRTGHTPWLEASEAAIQHLLTHSRRDVRHGPYGGGDVLWVDESNWIKLGGAGLALVMLTQHMQATGSDVHLEDARAYARFLVSQQEQSGQFVYFANRVPGEPPRDRTSAYYPGEAILGLVQLYAVDPNPLWLDTAVRGADWLIDERDAGKGPRALANDHWLMIALSHLVHHTHDERYVAHSQALVDAVAYQADKNHPHVATHADYAGGYYDPPRSTPAATRGEGLVAVLDTCAIIDDACAPTRALLEDTVCHELWSQYRPELLWWMPRPGDVVGGFAGGIMDPDLRNDFTQHNLSAVLGAERHLRETETAQPGGPTWSWQRQQGWEGVAPDRMDALLAPLRAVRGLHRWDPVATPDEGPSLPLQDP